MTFQAERSPVTSQEWGVSNPKEVVRRLHEMSFKVALHTGGRAEFQRNRAPSTTAGASSCASVSRGPDRQGRLAIRLAGAGRRWPGRGATSPWRSLGRRAAECRVRGASRGRQVLGKIQGAALNIRCNPQLPDCAIRQSDNDVIDAVGYAVKGRQAHNGVLGKVRHHATRFNSDGRGLPVDLA